MELVGSPPPPAIVGSSNPRPPTPRVARREVDDDEDSAARWATSIMRSSNSPRPVFMRVWSDADVWGFDAW